MHSNYTVTSTQITANAGEQVNLTTPSIVLTITADAGYTVTDTDFTIGDALPSEVTSAVLSQNGLVVECLVTFDDSFIMPSSNVSLPIDIDGAAVLSGYTINGFYNINTSNTNQTTATNIPYSGVGNFGDVVTLFTLTFTADANYAFETDPNYIIYLTNKFPENYSITRVDTTGALGLTQVVYTVKYTITADYPTTDFIEFYAYAAEQLIAGPTAYYSYVFDGFDSRGLNGIYTMGSNVQTHTLRVYGDYNALVSVDITNITAGGTTTLYTNEPIIDQGGYIELPIAFDAVVVDTTYNITLYGDIAVPFIQVNPIVVIADTGVTAELSHNPLAGYTVVRSGTFIVNGITGPVDYTQTSGATLTTQFRITKDDGSVIKLRRTPTFLDFSNTDPNSNTGTDYRIAYPIDTVGDGTTTIIISMTVYVVQFGQGNVISYLDLTDLFNVNPIAVDDAASVNKGDLVTIDVLVNDSSPIGNPLTPVIITQPFYGIVRADLSGNLVYKHDNSENYIDSFTYAANDGYIDSNIATVNIGIGVAAGESFSASSTAGIFYVPIVVGNAGGTFTAHFNSYGVPDRVEMLYAGNIVADTLFVGDDLIGAARASSIASIIGTTELDSFDYVGSNGDGTLYGKSAEWNLKTLGNLVAYSDPTDIAPTGNIRADGNSNFGGQVGVGNLVYTSISDVIGITGLDSADGNISVSFVVPPGGASVVTLKITGIVNTGWAVFQTSMV